MHERISEKVNNYNGKAPERSRRRLIMFIISPLAIPLHDVWQIIFQCRMKWNTVRVGTNVSADAEKHYLLTQVTECFRNEKFSYYPASSVWRLQSIPLIEKPFLNYNVCLAPAHRPGYNPRWMNAIKDGMLSVSTRCCFSRKQCMWR